jgi:hypothetical protein
MKIAFLSPLYYPKIPARSRLHSMLTAKFISDTGSWLSTVLILLYTNEIAVAKAQAISSVFIVRLLMPLILTPWIAKFVDRSPSGRWLVICDLMAAAMTITIPFFHLNWATALIAGTLSILAVFAALISYLFRPSHRVET